MSKRLVRLKRDPAEKYYELNQKAVTIVRCELISTNVALGCRGSYLLITTVNQNYSFSLRFDYSILTPMRCILTKHKCIGTSGARVESIAHKFCGTKLNFSRLASFTAITPISV